LSLSWVLSSWATARGGVWDSLPSYPPLHSPLLRSLLFGPM
jgi:hypothetical protein